MQLSRQSILNRLVAIAALFASPIAIAGGPKQWSGSSGGNNHWYQLFRADNPISWNEAHSLAASVGGHLATCTTAEEYAFVRDAVVLPDVLDPNEFGPYLGGQLVNGAWTWVTGEPWSYTAWGESEPNGDASSPWLHIYRWSSPWWNDTNGFPDHRSYVVEWDEDCSGNGIVDFGQILAGELADENGNFVPDCCELGLGCDNYSGAVEWPTAEGGNGHWYLFDQQLRHWDLHRGRAEELGAHLATITSQGEQGFVEAIVHLQEADIWLGGESPWPLPVAWITGERFGYSNWMPGGYNPGGGYAIEMCARAECVAPFAWNIESESGAEWPGNRAVYEWSADCNGDGIVDYGQILAGDLVDANGNNTPDCCEQGSTCVLLTSPVEWRVELGGNGHWYARLGLSPSEAAEEHFVRAETLGGHTATITSEGENAFCFALVGSTSPLIGVRKVLGNNQGAWVTGETWDFANWHAGEGQNATERYALMQPDWNGEWQDTDLTPYAASLVEWSADCNADGIVDFGQILSGDLADVNGNNIPDCCEGAPACNCFGDVTGNGVVDGVDLAAMLGSWGTSGQGQFDCDVNNDGIVDGADLAVLLGDWGACR